MVVPEVRVAGMSAEEDVERWFAGKTKEEIDAMADDAAREAVKVVQIAEALMKLKQAEGSGLSHVVLNAKEIGALMTLLRTLQRENKKT